MKVEFRPEARDQALARNAWWVENRPAAPTAFRDELALALRDLAEQPTIAPVILEHGGASVRRWLLPKSKSHLYFTIDTSRDVIDILAVWGARMGRMPPLAKGRA